LSCEHSTSRLERILDSLERDVELSQARVPQKRGTDKRVSHACHETDTQRARLLQALSGITPAAA